jgi:two-component sensor histidine kinase/PAS domain-containing protein
VNQKPAWLPQEAWQRLQDPGRGEVIAALSVADSFKDEDFLRINRLAASVFNVPSAAIVVVDDKHAWLLSAHGVVPSEIDLVDSLALHVIAGNEPALVCADASADARFAGSSLVTGAVGLRYYAGAQIVVRGHRIGALQVFGREPRASTSESELQQLIGLAATAGRLFELKDEARVRERTAAELIREEWRHALTLEAGRVGSWVWDIRTGTVTCNDILRRMFALPPAGPVQADQIFDAMLPGDKPAVDAALKATFEDGVDYVSEFRIASTGRWLVGRGRVYQRDSKGAPLVMMGVNIDITEAREASEQTRLLVRELNHRVKNTLAMIQSLARQTMRRSDDPDEFLETFTARLRTLSEAHTLLSDRDWSGIGLVELVETRVGPYLRSEGQLKLSGEDVQLPPDHALGLGLVLHELAVNAARFGALSTAEGSVGIAWSLLPSRQFEINWTERGGPVVHGGERGFGMELIERGLDKVLGSKVVFSLEPKGAEAKISFPLDAG